MSMDCPICNRPLEEPRVPLSALALLPLSPSELVVIGVLVKAYPRPTTLERVVSALYRGVIGGGPDDADGVARQIIHKARKKLQPYGWSIPSARAGRGSMGEYRLVARSEP